MRTYALSIRKDEAFITKARNYYESLLFAGTPGGRVTGPIDEAQQIRTSYTLLWESAYTINISGHTGTVISVVDKRFISAASSKLELSGTEHFELLIWQDYREAFHVEPVTIIPHKCNGSTDIRHFTGFILSGQWPGNKLRVMNFGNRSEGLAKGGGAVQLLYTGDENEYVSDATEEPLAKDSTFTVTSGDRLISNISEYFKCFDNVPGSDHTYQIKLCVAQPNTGSRDAWSFSSVKGTSATSNPVYVGHTFLILSEVTQSRTTVRNIGFYPRYGVSPFSPESQGALNNDEQHDYDIVLTITVTNSQFFSVLNYLSQGNNKGYNYNLNTNNCTTFALDALAAGFISVPRTIGSWTNGQGLNPGDLGEDIRILKLSSNMTRTTMYGTHPNVGFCY